MRTMVAQKPAWRPFLGQVSLRGSVRLGDASELTDENFDMAMNAPAAAIDFWSPMCAPCLQYKPVFEDAATQAPDGVLMATINADYGKQMMDLYQIESLPTTLYLVGGKEVGRTEGVQTKATVLAEVAKIAPSAQRTAQASTPSQGAAPSQTTVQRTSQGPVSPLPVEAHPSAQAPAPVMPSGTASISTRTLLAGGLGLVLVAGLLTYAFTR